MSRSSARAAALGLAVALSASALASPEVAVGLSGGVALPGGSVRVGPAVALSVDVAPWRQLAFELRAEQSFHRQAISRTSTLAAQLTSVGLGIQYRIDFATVIPYASAVVFGERYALSTVGEQLSVGGSVALGLWVPFAGHAFAGAEARYGFSFDSSVFPSGRGFFATIGARFGGPPSP